MSRVVCVMYLCRCPCGCDSGTPDCLTVWLPGWDAGGCCFAIRPAVFPAHAARLMVTLSSSSRARPVPSPHVSFISRICGARAAVSSEADTWCSVL